MIQRILDRGQWRSLLLSVAVNREIYSLRNNGNYAADNGQLIRNTHGVKVTPGTDNRLRNAVVCNWLISPPHHQ